MLDLPYSELRSVSFLGGKMSFDVMWIPTEIVTVDGKTLMVRVPAYHPGTGTLGDTTGADRADDDLGARAWLCRGAGQRDLKASMEEEGP